MKKIVDSSRDNDVFTEAEKKEVQKTAKRSVPSTQPPIAEAEVDKKDIDDVMKDLEEVEKNDAQNMDAELGGSVLPPTPGMSQRSSGDYQGRVPETDYESAMSYAEKMDREYNELMQRANYIKDVASAARSRAQRYKTIGA